MKQIAFISFILFFSFATSRGLKRFARDEDHKGEIVSRFKDLKEENFKKIAIVMFAQYLYKCPYEHIVKRAQNIVDLAHKCIANEEDPECLKTLPAIFLDEICRIQELGEAYGAMAGCCSKDDPERHLCFLSFKHTTPGFLPPYQRPEPEVMCKEFQENKASFIGHHIYEVSRRHPYLYGPTILALIIEVERSVEFCCKEASIETCLDEKLLPIKEKALLANKISTYVCGILEKFGDKNFEEEVFVIMSQKFPKAPFSEIKKIVKDITRVHMECCDGDMIECMDDRAEVVSYICSKQDIFSSKIKNCCEKPVVEQTECVVMTGFDDKPADLPSIAEKYIEDKEVCKHFTEGQEAFLDEFIYEYSRRHPEFSSQLLLRIVKGYTTLLEECCKKENAPECYSHAEEELRKHIQEVQELVKTTCDLFASLGDYGFQKIILACYTRKMPQVSTETLIEISKKMTEIGSKCCQEPEDRRLLCSGRHLSLVIHNMCRRLEAIPVPINEKVRHCCNDSYADRRPCFTKLGIDENYVPPTFSPEMFTFHEDLCTAETQQSKELKDLVNLVKLKTTVTDEQLKKISTDFTNMVQKCCKAENHETCFEAEGPKLKVEIKVILGIAGV